MWRHTLGLAERCAPLIIDDSDKSSKLQANLRGPLFAAAAAGITMYDDLRSRRERRHCERKKKRQAVMLISFRHSLAWQNQAAWRASPTRAQFRIRKIGVSPLKKSSRS